MLIRPGVPRPSPLCWGQGSEAVSLQVHCASSACDPPRRAHRPLVCGQHSPSLPNCLGLSVLSLKSRKHCGGGKCQMKGYSECSPPRTVYWLQNSLKDFHTTTRMRFSNHIFRNMLLKTSTNSSSGLLTNQTIAKWVVYLKGDGYVFAAYMVGKIRGLKS